MSRASRPLARVVAIAIASAIAAALLLVVLPGFADAAATPRRPAAIDGDAPSLRLDRQTTWVEPGAPFSVQVSAAGAVDDRATVDATVYAATPSRSSFAAQLEGDQLGSQLASSGPVALLASTRPTARVRFSTGGVAGPGDVPVELDGPGVYPVEIRLVAPDGAVLDRLVTHLVRLPATTADLTPLRVAMVLPLDGGPGLRPNGERRSDPAGRARVDALVDALNRAPDVPATVVPTPDTVESLSPARLARVRRAVADRQVVSSQYVPLDVAAWVTAGLDDDLARQTTAGEEALADRLVDRPDRRTVLTDAAVTPDAVTRLSDLGADQFVIPEEALAPLDAATFPTTLAQPFEVQDSGGQPQRSVGADAQLAAHIGETGDPTLDAAHLLADLAVIYFDRPGTTRGVTVALPRVWDPSTAFLATLFGGLDQAQAGGIVRPVTVDQLFAQVPEATAGGGALVRALAPQASPALGGYPSSLPLTRLTTEGFASFADPVGPADGARGGEQENPLVLSMERRLLISGSADLDRAQRSAYLAAISDQIHHATDAVVAPRTGNITLTSRDGQVPMNISNENLYDVTVLLHFDSDKLEFPGGDNMIVHLPRSQVRSFDIAVRARSSGSFPFRMTITSPDEIVVVSHSRFTVRSTAVSGVGLVLSVGAGLFLALWWASHFRKVRRARKLVAADEVPTAL